MKNKLKILINLSIIVLIIILWQSKVQAKSYYIDNMNIQATICPNGDVEVEQTLEYQFNGSYNGIYLTIPTSFENKEKIISKINNSNYNAESVELQTVSLVRNSEDVIFKKVYDAKEGNSGVYTEEKNFDEYKLKIFSPSNNVNKKFVVKYILKNVCVSHNDVGELYYNFIGGKWQCTIKNLNIDIMLPNNNSELKVWGHGPDNGESKIINNNNVNFKVSNVATGKYVATRLLFDKSNIPYSRKISNINAKDLVLEEEKQIAKISDEKQAYTKRIYIFALILLIYWIILLIIYEKDKKYPVVQINEDELFEKYNPMIAGCLQETRDILARDIIAVILNLIEKKNVKLEIKQAINKNKTYYYYYLTKVQEKEQQMDEVERLVYNWIFESNSTIELTEALKELPKDKKASEKFKHLNDVAQEKLNKKGANQKKVPEIIRIINVIIFFITIYVSIKHVLYEGFEIYNSYDIFFFGLGIVAQLFPILIFVIYLPILLVVNIRQQITKMLNKITGQRVVTTAVTIIAIFFIIILVTLVFANKANNYIIADEVLICISLIIMLTDNLMLKNSAIMIEDYSKVNALKEKIENCTLMEDRDIEQVTLWGKYLAYAVSFGIAEKVVKRIKGLYLNDDLLNVLNNEEITDYIFSDYMFFYYNTSLDRRFLKGYKNTISKMASNAGSGSSFGGGGGFSGGRRILPVGGGGGRRSAEHFK